jgi:hypothetical protein
MVAVLKSTTPSYILLSTMSLKRAPRQRVELRLRRSAVQNALAIDEILRMITLQLRGDSASLLALAVTCKTWSAVALNELWTEISSQQLARISLMRVGTIL